MTARPDQVALRRRGGALSVSGAAPLIHEGNPKSQKHLEPWPQLLRASPFSPPPALRLALRWA